MLHGGKQPLEIGSLQQVLWLLFQVGGELVGWMAVGRDFTLPSCALTHTVLPLSLSLSLSLSHCSRWLIFTAVCPCSSDGKQEKRQQCSWILCKCYSKCWGGMSFCWSVVSFWKAAGYKTYSNNDVHSWVLILSLWMSLLSPRTKGLAAYCFFRRILTQLHCWLGKNKSFFLFFLAVF